MTFFEMGNPIITIFSRPKFIFQFNYFYYFKKSNNLQLKRNTFKVSKLKTRKNLKINIVPTYSSISVR